MNEFWSKPGLNSFDHQLKWQNGAPDLNNLIWRYDSDFKQTFGNPLENALGLELLQRYLVDFRSWECEWYGKLPSPYSASNKTNWKGCGIFKQGIGRRTLVYRHVGLLLTDERVRFEQVGSFQVLPSQVHVQSGFRLISSPIISRFTFFRYGSGAIVRVLNSRPARDSNNSFSMFSSSKFIQIIKYHGMSCCIRSMLFQVQGVIGLGYFRD